MSEDIAIGRMSARLSSPVKMFIRFKRRYISTKWLRYKWLLWVFSLHGCYVEFCRSMLLWFFLLGILFLSQWLNIISTMSVAIFIVIVIGSIIYFNFMLTLLVLCIITCTFYANDEENGIVFIPNDEENSI